MAKVECMVCSKGMLTTSKNSNFNNGVWTHKKCPSAVKKMSPEDVASKLALTDRISYLAVLHDKPLNWIGITGQIQQLKTEGYSYEEQLYTLNYVYEMDKEEFWGYGRTKKFVEHARAHKKKQDEYEKRKAEMEEKSKTEETSGLKFKSNNSFMNF